MHWLGPSETHGRGYKGYRYFGNRLLITACTQSAGAPFIDHVFSGDADRNRYQGVAILMFPRHKNEYGEHESQVALVIAFANPAVARVLDPQKYRRAWRSAHVLVSMALGPDMRRVLIHNPKLIPFTWRWLRTVARLPMTPLDLDAKEFSGLADATLTDEQRAGLADSGLKLCTCGPPLSDPGDCPIHSD